MTSHLAPRLSATMVGLLLVTAVGLVGGADPARAQTTYTVTNTNDTGTGSLRAIIDSTNNGSGTPPDTIAFDISGSASPSSPHVIEPGSALPNVTDPVVIDGTSEPDYNSGNHSDPKPVVEVNGRNFGGTAEGFILDASGNTIRALAVVNFGGNGIEAEDGTTEQTIVGCHVGVRADGTTAAGNGGSGIALSGSNNQIGGTGPDAGNIVGNNSTFGLVLTESSTTIQGNFIGTNPSFEDLGNSGPGVYLGSPGDGNTVGGIGPGEPNVIAFNATEGVTVVGSGATGHTIRGNRMFGNEGLGIDLANDGATSNDNTPAGSEDDDDGENRLQNFPVITNTSYDSGANEITVTYKVPSQPGLSGAGTSTYPITVDFYRANTSGDPEGAAFLHADSYSASAFNNGPTKTITFTPDASVSSSDRLVATATDANGNTSEFSGASNTLPVELASLDATQSGKSAVRLTWRTASETGSAGFEVQRRDGAGERGTARASWQTIGYVESKAEGGTSSRTLSYRFTAEDLGVGTHAFRLKQVDLDGTTTVHDAVTVELTMQQTLRLSAPSPHPVRERATISFAVKEKTEAAIVLYNTLGQRVTTVYRGTPPAGEQQTTRLNVVGLASGTYFLRLTGGGAARTQQVTVVR